jgi:hypothetical protein
MRIFVASAGLIASALLLQGCFFVYIPGSAIDATSDAITGARGDNCVAAGAKVGDTIRLTTGGYASVVSLSGPSPRCTQPEFPIRALLQPYTPSPSSYWLQSVGG